MATTKAAAATRARLTQELHAHESNPFDHQWAVVNGEESVGQWAARCQACGQTIHVRAGQYNHLSWERRDAPCSAALRDVDRARGLLPSRGGFTPDVSGMSAATAAVVTGAVEAVAHARKVLNAIAAEIGETECPEPKCGLQAWQGGLCAYHETRKRELARVR